MRGLWIAAAVLVLLLALLWMRLGVLARFGGQTAEVFLRLGPFRFSVFPPKKEKTEKKRVKKSKPENSKKKNEKKKSGGNFPKLSRKEWKEALFQLWPPLKRTLDKTRRGIRVDPLQLSVTVAGGEDPAAAAETYGYIHAAVWTAMPVLERLVSIPRPGIHIGLDFDREQTELAGTAGVTVRVGTLLGIGFSMAIPVLRWYLQLQKKQKAAPSGKDGRQPENETAAEPPAA